MGKKLVLFDIDGTLITKCLLHEKSFSVGFKEVFGIDVSIDFIANAGKTDKKVIVETLMKKGLTKKQILSKIDEMYNKMSEYVGDKIDSDYSFGLIPKAKYLLAELKKRRACFGFGFWECRKNCKVETQKIRFIGFFQSWGIWKRF